MRVESLGGHPIEQYDSPNKGGAMSGHRGLVLHSAEGTYRGTIAWQLNGDQRYSDGTRVTTSSTFVVGRSTGEWAQLVDTDTVAWCQRGGSLEWLSIELAGYAPAAPTPWQVQACAQLLAWAHGAYGVPVRAAAHPGERGLGHHSMDREWMGEEWGHEACPGTGVVTSKAAIVQRALAILQEEYMPSPEELWGVEYGDYVELPDGKRPAINTKHALFSARRDAYYARKGVAQVNEKLSRATPITLHDDQLRALATMVADALGALVFVPNAVDRGDESATPPNG